MRRFRFLCLALVVLLPPMASVLAGPRSYNLEQAVPPVIQDRAAIVPCTVTFLVEDTANGDLFAQRIRIATGDGDPAVDGRLSCPTDVLPRLPSFARDVCTLRAADKNTCVFADMTRAFAARPEIGNTTPLSSQCRSDTAAYLGAACWMNGVAAICNVGCGNSIQEALNAARARCQQVQGRSCPASVAVAVSEPDVSPPPVPGARQAGR
ncbi:MAG: hypothetical protein JSS43_09525 [Proteobacteria bacterium]|nr:hypothetical protein [Pseudomonadota bacterium]